MLTSKTNRAWSSFAFILSIVTVAFAAWLFLNRQYALDQLTVWAYQPTASVQNLDTRVQFTDKGLFTFYATKPIVAEPSEFNGKCPRQEAGSPILGCYTPEDRIYVFNVTNSQLDGMKEVTAAHEMLHAAWSRMSTSEQTRVGALLSAAYEKTASDELRERMEYYKRTEPKEITNELHSILGTEVTDLGAELEGYYGQYFKDRQTILDLYAKYNAVYKSLYNQADALYTEMQALSASIEARSTSYDGNVAQLSSDITSFNARANGGEFNSVSQFNREKSVLVQRSDRLEAQRKAIYADIAIYNKMYDEYKILASQIEILNNSVDSFKTLGDTPTV
jgi:hypothetical protein